jgi:ATP-dependent DNA helicase RecG
MDLNSGLNFIKGIGEQRVRLLEKLEIFTLYDLVSYFPRDYQDRSVIKGLDDIIDGETACVRAYVTSAPVLNRIRKGMELVKFKIADNSGSANVTFFNQSYVKNNIKRGEAYTFFGKFTKNIGRLEILNPIFEKEGAEGDLKSTGRIVPVYRLTAGISQKVLSRAIAQGLKAAEGLLPETLPEDLRNKYGLIDVTRAYNDIHFPSNMLDAEKARERLVFEELFVLACALGSMKLRSRDEAGRRIKKVILDEFLNTLPFTLTDAQKRAAEQALADMSSGKAMNRLVQGDVGSGKTVVAAACVWAVYKSGFQSAFMAPTELLADQHYATLNKLLSPLGVRTVLLKGSMTAKQKREAYDLLASGEADLVVGTHALISEGVKYKSLALAVTDEQHRFGVNQRAALSEKTDRPHVLVMSATPIPRTLALIIFGDLDVSIINELPPGRQKVDTFAVGEDMRGRINNFIRKLVTEGRQVYIVCPMIEESEAVDLQSATDLYEKLKNEVFPDFKLALLHGKMKAADKEAVMSSFIGGETDILVSTTVIEVGVDVPNAALMVIENADRFGLSQLHQLRGRVGRGKHKSYCVLFKGGEGQNSSARLEAMTRLSDGFKISEEDLKLRGPGDFFGSRQHGLPELKIAELGSSLDVLSWAQTEAEALLNDDPRLDRHPELKEKVVRLFDMKLS